MDIIIRKVKSEEIKDLKKIGEMTFFETFSSENSEENMKEYLESQYSIEKIESELNNINSEFYFALLNNEIVGYLKINQDDAQTEIKEKNGLEIERIYILNTFQVKNIGQTLYNKAIEIAKKHNKKYVWLGVWENNLKAIQFYEKNGFKVFDKHIFHLGDDEQIDLMMKLEL